MKEVDILNDILDFEVLPDESVLIFKKNGQRVLVKSATESFKEKCYDLMAKTFSVTQKVTKRKKIHWSEEEKLFLEKNLSLDLKVLSEILKKSYYQINFMKGKLNLIDRKPWTEDELDYLKKNLYKNNSLLAEELNRTIFSIKSKKNILKNKK